MITVKAPDGVSGDWSVQTFEVSKQDSDFTRIRAACHPDEFVPPGKYKRLMCGGTVVMSNTPMEERTNSAIIHRATGNVLINGLGLGMVLTAILEKDHVDNVTVVEISEDVINLVGSHFKDPRVKIIHDDALKFKPAKGSYFHAVWHDIWTDICSDNLKEMTTLKRKYGRRCAWQGCWSEWQCRRQLRFA